MKLEFWEVRSDHRKHEVVLRGIWFLCGQFCLPTAIKAMGLPGSCFFLGFALTAQVGFSWHSPWSCDILRSSTTTILTPDSPLSNRKNRVYSVSIHGAVLNFAQLCPILCNPIDHNPPGSSVHRTFQARILEWVAISYSRGYSRPRDRTCISCFSCISRVILCHCTTKEAPRSYSSFVVVLVEILWLLLISTPSTLFYPDTKIILWRREKC